MVVRLLQRSRDQYNSKLAKLKANYKRGLIDKETYDRFEAELVGCLQ